MKGDIPVEVPDVSLEPHGRLTLDELFNQWDEVRNKLPGLLAEITSKNKDNPVYRHLYGGPLDVAETLSFIDVHFDNHQRHIDRILVESNIE